MRRSWPSFKPRLVAIAGGSGAGKSWLVERLQKLLGKEAAGLCLDDFYRDRSELSPRQRARINYDHPRAIDWPVLEGVLLRLLAGKPGRLPRYDFKAHTRDRRMGWLRPKPVILVEGLWLLRPASLRRLFDLSIFIDCPERVRLRQRLARDVLERGRSRASVRRQFFEAVAPMHARYVAPQARRANVVVKSPLRAADVEHLAARIRALL